MKIDSFIKQYSNHLVLFIGAGFSLRYLENSFTWEGLLKHICLELTGNKKVYLDFKSESIRSDGSCLYEEIAGKLEKLFNETLSNDRDDNFKEINDNFYNNMEKGIKLSCFKIYTAQLLDEKKLKENTENKIAALKRVRKNVGSVITTNYDNLIESLFDFNPLIGNSIFVK
ncbi:hypothetical protein [Carnobacterium alterfunditum]|uniref:hypothetical protein n=1 Tax=Carnobacterium alterfunditum TaxID=28230 RepID=UPI003593900D